MTVKDFHKAHVPLTTISSYIIYLIHIIYKSYIVSYPSLSSWGCPFHLPAAFFPVDSRRQGSTHGDVGVLIVLQGHLATLPDLPALSARAAARLTKIFPSGCLLFVRRCLLDVS